MKPAKNPGWSWRQPHPHLLTALVFLTFAVLTVIMTWPIAGRLGSQIPGRDGDAWVHLWTFRWVKDALLSGQNPYYTNLLFYPSGTSLYSHNIAWVNIAAWLPLQALFGEEVAYSLLFLAVIAFNGFASYLLICELAGSRVVGFVGGLIVAFWPFTLAHHDHPNLIFIAWIPLALLFLKRFLEAGKIRDLLLVALFIALIGLTRWQLLIMGGFIIGLYLLAKLAGDRASLTVHKLGLLALAGLLAGLLMLPFLLPIAKALSANTVPEDLFLEAPPHSSDLLAYLLPNQYHPLWGEAVSSLYEGFPTRSETPFIGYTTLFLVIVGLFARWRQSRIWLLAALLLFALALGPKLYVNGKVLDAPTPYSLIADSVFIQMLRRPTRLNIVLSIPIAIIAAYGIGALLHRLHTKWHKIALTSIIITLILLEYVVSYRTFPLVIPDWYTELAKEPGEFGILGIPMNPQLRPDKTYMFYQSVHGKPIVEGHVSRIPPEANAFISQTLLLNKARFEKMQVLKDEIVDVSGQLQQLSEANIRYLILHKQFLADDERLAWQQWLGFDPYHEDADLVVYRTDPQLGRDFSLTHELTAGPDGELEIALIRTVITPTTTTLSSTVQLAANWYAGSDVTRDYALCLSLVDEENQVVQSQCEPLAENWPTSRWRAGELFFSNHAIDISPYHDPGDYTLALSLADDQGVAHGWTASIADLTIAGQPRVFDEPEPSLPAHVTWADAIYLPGYDLSQTEDDSLTVTLYWQAKRRMDDSYTNFVHLIDPESGQLVAQADVIPRGWTYPTNWWEQGEVVEDTIRLPLENVPPGEYELHVGWYNMEDGERLPAYSYAGELYPERTVFLTTIER